MSEKGFAWECECGQVDYGEYPPGECPSCQAVDSFEKIPDDLVEEKEAENVLSFKEELEDEN